MKALTSYIRQSTLSQQILGQDIHRIDNVSGEVNVIKGHAEMEFKVKGDKTEGLCVYKGTKINSWNQWHSHVFCLKMEDGTIVDLTTAK